MSNIAKNANLVTRKNKGVKNAKKNKVSWEWRVSTKPIVIGHN